jgi:hypothetical protein
MDNNVAEIELSKESQAAFYKEALKMELDYEPIEQEIENQGDQPLLMNIPFDPTLINIETKTPSLDTLIKRIQHNEIVLDSASYFQRADNLWTREQQSRLIESILIRFPLPAFYFDGSDKNKWLVVDGLQRLSSIRNFAVNKTLRLTNLEFLTQLNGKSYDELDRDLQRIIEETTIVTYTINPGTPVDVKFNIFKRINTGGLVLEPQEIRHALFQGKPAEFIAELGDCPEFAEATGKSLIRNRRMLNRDFANRFLCFYLFGYDKYEPDLDTFMSKAMAAINKMSEEQKDAIKKNYIASLNLNKVVFGNHAFRKIDHSGKRKPINKAIFDAFSVQFALLSKEERLIIELEKEEVVTGFISLLYEDTTFFWSISSATGDKNRVFYRHQKIKELVETIIHYYDPINHD